LSTRQTIDKVWSLVIVLPLILLSTAFLGVVSAAIALFGSRTSPLQIAVARVWSRSILFMGGVKVEVEGRERLHARGPYVFVANHLSFIDTPVVLASIPGSFDSWRKRSCSGGGPGYR
jgi:1-acyl-sn-glycerol-3-phosphate acyltransferase